VNKQIVPVFAVIALTIFSINSASAIPQDDAETECRKDMILVFREISNKYACVTEETAAKWVQHGLAVLAEKMKEETVEGPAGDTAEKQMQMANPASTHCIDNGGTLEIVTDDQGQRGMCTLPDGIVCEEWAYFSGKCPAESKTAPVSLLFVQTAHSGTLLEEDGKLVLTLNGASPTTVFFSDRPNRISGHESTLEFVNRWAEDPDSFADDPPNAAIDILEGDEKGDVLIVELTNPVFDLEMMTLQYTVQMLEDVSDGISHYAEHADESLPESFGHVAVFIDNCRATDIILGEPC